MSKNLTVSSTKDSYHHPNVLDMNISFQKTSWFQEREERNGGQGSGTHVGQAGSSPKQQLAAAFTALAGANLALSQKSRNAVMTALETAQVYSPAARRTEVSLKWW